MLFKTRFDLIFGIGEACSCTQILRKCRLQFYSYPFDWLFGSDILTRANILANDYNEFIDLDDLEDANLTNKDEVNLCEIFYNKKNKIYFNHDFPYGKTLQESYEKVKEKYDRRAKRLLEQIEKSRKVLVVYVQVPNSEQVVDDSILIEAKKTIQKRFPNQEISLLYLYCNRENTKIDLKEISKNVIKADFDYDAYNKELPYVVNNKVLQKLFCKLKITGKYMNIKNKYHRLIYLTKCFFRGML